MGSRCTSVEQFASLIHHRFEFERPESIWSLEPPLLDFASSTAPTEALNRELRAIAEDPGYDGNWPLNRIVLHRGTGITLVLRLLNEESAYIRTVPFYGIFVPLGQLALRYESYCLPSAYDNQVFNPDIKLEPLGVRETACGSSLRVSPGTEIPHFRVPRPQLVLQLSTAPVQYLQWLFSRESLLAWQANDSSMNFSQLRVAGYILGKFAHQTSLGSLSALTTHPHHAVRWTAIQGLGRISRSAALEKLQSAVNDTHPHVRRAATKTLQQLQQSKR